MNREDIIRMARKAGFMPTVLNHWPYELERFAALVAENVVDGMVVMTHENFKSVWDKAQAEEREACAKVCEEYQDAVDRHKWPNGYQCAAAIRARGNT